MKKHLIIIMMALVAIACSREEQPASDGNTRFAPGQDTMTVIACTETSDTTKTSLLGDDANGYDVLWSEGDQIKIGSETFVLSDGAGTTRGVFSGNKLADGTYTAYYATSDGKVPLSQTYTKGKIANSPMTAQVTVTGGEASIANFINIGGLLHLTIKKVKPVTVKGIAVNGMLKTSGTRIILDCSSSPVELTEAGSEFYIAMPPGNFTEVYIEINPDSDKMYKKTMSSGNSLIITRSQITNASFKTNTLSGHEFVNLGLPSGLMWATCNIGAGTPEEVGTYFAWGETKGKEGALIFSWDNYKFYDLPSELTTKYDHNKTTLDPEDDAAVKQWKEGWRMPTAAEYQELIDNCYWEYSQNNSSTYYDLPQGWLVFKAKTEDDKGKMCDANSKGKILGYTLSDTHIFLPAGGRMENETLKYSWCCYYWTSSLSDMSIRCGQNLAATNLELLVINNTDTYRYYGEPIRAVCE